MQTTQEEIASLEQFAKEAESFAATTRKKLEELRAKAQPAPSAWSPTSGGWCIAHHWNGTRIERVVDQKPDMGFQYSTREAAEAAKNYLAWYALLLNLAAQVNPSGKPGGPFAIRNEGRSWQGGLYQTHWVPARIFETSEAMYKALEILNRQNGVLAGIPCPF